jgi:hypothetical protein
LVSLEIVVQPDSKEAWGSQGRLDRLVIREAPELQDSLETSE